MRALGSTLPTLSRFAISRSMLLAQLSARPWRLDGELIATELTSYANTPTFNALVHDLASSPEQVGPAAESSHPIIIGWGRQDRLCLPRQAARAKAAFPSAKIHWFEKCGHFPIWDQSDEAVQLILDETVRIRN